jgi:hypothetical protein
MRFLLAAVMLLLLRGIERALATALRAIDGHIGGTLKRQGAGGDPARVTLWRHAESGKACCKTGSK